MHPVEPPLHDNAIHVTFAQNQPEYDRLPASVDAQGTVMTEWLPSAEDLANLMNGGHVRIWLLHTGVERGKRLTPIAVETTDGK